MPRKPADPVKPRDIQGLKYLDRLLPLLDQLHEVGCDRDRAGNRRLYYDQYCLLVLLSLFNPIIRSLRSIQQVSQLQKVQRKLGCSRVALGSLSEAVAVFDPERLTGIIAELAAQVRPVGDVRQGRMADVLTAVDGTVIRTLKSIAEATFLVDRAGGTHAAWRLHTHFEVDRHIPVRIDVTAASNGGRNDEKARLRAALQRDRCYVMDRWYAQFTLWNDIVQAGSGYVCRIRDNSVLDAVVEDRPISAEATAAGVVGDQVVELGMDRKPEERPDHPVRVILVKTTPHTKRGGRQGQPAGPSSDGVLRIATSYRDVPAEVIADIYRHRWTIELFFRFFKHVLGCRHLLSTQPKGVAIQAYCAIIACLLMRLWTDRKPTLRTYEMICLYFAGWATVEELLEHISKLLPDKV